MRTPLGMGMPLEGLLLQLGQAYSFAPAPIIPLADSSSRMDVWEKLITAFPSAGSGQAPLQLQLPCLMMLGVGAGGASL